MVAKHSASRKGNNDLPGDKRLTAEEQAAADAAAADAAVDAAAVNQLIEELRANAELIQEEPDQLAATRAEVEEIRDRYIRLQAEWDNYRKRTAQEREQERRRAAESVMDRLLPVIDDLERAIEHSGTSNAESLKGGIVAVYNKLNDALAKEGLKSFAPQGEPFDALRHQAVGKQSDPGVFDETVVQVLQKGYEIGGRVLRAAMVVVSEGGPKRIDEQDEE